MKILVIGAGGFIGNAIVTRLISQGHYVRGVDIKEPAFQKSLAQEFLKLDCRNYNNVENIIRTNDGDTFDQVFHLAADMGGADYIFTGLKDADIMSNSLILTINILRAQAKLNKELGKNKTKMFYASSACVYPEHNQLTPDNPNCKEDTVYPAHPDSDYGWEKLFGERLFQAYNRNYNIPIRIARYHNIYGPGSEYQGGREKAPAALCRKVLTSDGTILIYGDGSQTRSFLFIEDAVDATLMLMNSEFDQPINIGSEEMVSINDFVDIICKIENKSITKIHKLDGPLGVRGRNSDNTLIRQVLNWEPKFNLTQGITLTYNFIKGKI
jgi:nucleoside-diphosphate-sugar epimerase